MKFLVLTVALLAAINVATCDFTPSTSGESYLQYLKERSQIESLRSKFESICPGKSDEFDNAVLELKECVNEIDENTETMCSAIKNHYLRCSKPFVQLLETCLPEESKEIPSLIAQSMNSVILYVCKTDGEHIFEMANSCVFKTNYRTIRCERRVKTKLQQFRNKPPTKADLCEMAQSMKPCLHNHLQDSCGNQITRESFMGIFDAITAPCKTVSRDVEFVSNEISENDVELVR